MYAFLSGRSVKALIFLFPILALIVSCGGSSSTQEALLPSPSNPPPREPPPPTPSPSPPTPTPSPPQTKFNLGNNVTADVSDLVQKGGSATLVRIPYLDTADIVKLAPYGLYIQAPAMVSGQSLKVSGIQLQTQQEDQENVPIIVFDLPPNISESQRKYITVFVERLGENSMKIVQVAIDTVNNKLYLPATESGKYYITIFRGKPILETSPASSGPCSGEITPGLCIPGNQNFTENNPIDIYLENKFTTAQKVELIENDKVVDSIIPTSASWWQFSPSFQLNGKTGKIFHLSFKIALESWPYIDDYFVFDLPIKKKQSNNEALLRSYAPILEFGAFNDTNEIAKDLYGNYFYEIFLPTTFEKIVELPNTDLELKFNEDAIVKTCIFTCTKEYILCNQNLILDPRCLECIIGCEEALIDIKTYINPANLGSLGNFPRSAKYMIYSNAQVSTLNFFCDHNRMSCIDDGLVNVDNNLVKAYATYTEDDNYIYLQYWFYFTYDPKTPGGIKNYLISRYVISHYGDLERVTVILDKSTQLPKYVFFAHHNDDQKFAFLLPDKNSILKWNEDGFRNGENGVGGVLVPWEDVIKENGRPVVFVALGSHAMYPRRGFYAIDIPQLDPIGGNFDMDLKEFAGCEDIEEIYIGECRKIDFQDKLKIVPDVSLWGDLNTTAYKFLLFSGEVAGNKKIHHVKFFTYKDSYVNPSEKDGRDAQDCENGDVCREFPWLSATLGGTGEDVFMSTLFDEDKKKIVVSGLTYSAGQNGDAIIAAFNPDGTLYKVYTLGGSLRDQLYIRKLTDGSYLGFGPTDFIWPGVGDGWVVKFNDDIENLQVDWQVKLAAPGYNGVNGASDDGEYVYATLYSEGGPLGAADIGIVKLGINDGSIVKQVALGTSYYDGGYRVLVNGDRVFVVGYINSHGANSGISGGVVIKLDKDLNVDWVLLVDNPGEDAVYSITKVTDGYLITGRVEGSDGWSGYGFVAKIDAQGNVLWKKRINLNYSRIVSAVETGDGDYILVGWWGGKSNTDGFIIKLTKDGVFEDGKWIRGSGVDSLSRVTPIGNKNYAYEYLAGGSTTTSGSGLTDFLLVRFDKGLDYIYDLNGSIDPFDGNLVEDFNGNINLYRDNSWNSIMSRTNLNLTESETNYTLDEPSGNLIEINQVYPN